MCSKNAIADSLIKNIDKNFKNHLNTAQSNPQVSLHKKVDSLPSNNNAKNFKKNQNGHIPTYKNVPKKPVKRESQGSTGSMPQSAVFSPSNMPNSHTNNIASHRPIMNPNKNRNSQNIQSKSISQEKVNNDKKNSSI